MKRGKRGEEIFHICSIQIELSSIYPVERNLAGKNMRIRFGLILKKTAIFVSIICHLNLRVRA